MAGFFDLGEALVGGGIDREGARLEGLEAGSRINARKASTESALAKAAIDRDIAIARKQLRAQRESEAADIALVDLVLADMNPEQFTGAQLDRQTIGFRDDLANVALDPAARQGAGLALREAPITAGDRLGPGGELAVDVLDPTAPIQVTQTGTAQIGADQARAAEDLANAALLEEKRTNPTAFRSPGTTIQLGERGLGDVIVEDLGESTISPDIKPEAATGVRGAAQTAANAAFDIVNANLPFPDTDAAGNALTDLHARTQIVGQQAVPGRPSNYLMQQLAAFGVTPNDPFRGDQRSLNRMEQTERFLAGEVDSLRRILNAGRLTTAKVAAHEQALRNLEALRRDYAVVISRFNAGAPADAPQPDESGMVTLPSGATYKVNQ